MVMTLLELLARDIDIIADGLESLNQGEDFDLEMKGYIESHRVCAQHIREVLKWKEVPKGTKVHKIYDALVREGAPKGKAARIAQAKTGLSLATGKKPKRKRR
jgi:hypothetical protein